MMRRAASTATRSSAHSRAASSSSRGGLFKAGGRFSEAPTALMERFNASIGYDQRMWRQDIEGSRAYAAALARAGILEVSEAEALREGLVQVAAEWEAGTFELEPSDEDIHTANERRLTEIVGIVGGKLHTGRSRNDQVATDVRLWLKEEVAVLQSSLHELIRVAVERAESEVEILMPGYTHLQPAQPIRWSHWMLAHATSWQRDAERLEELAKRIDVMPLGSGALAGHPFGLDRAALAEELGFGAISSNSLDAVSDRDFVTEFLFFGSLHLVHLSRFAEVHKDSSLCVDLL